MYSVGFEEKAFAYAVEAAYVLGMHVLGMYVLGLPVCVLASWRKLLRCLQDNWPAISHDLAVEATRFEGFPKATNAKMVVEEGIFSREAQDVFTLERQSGDACSHLGCNSESQR